MTDDLVPDFFVLGAPKCGTTWLHAALEAHPAIDMTRPKECNVFSRPIDGDGRGADFVHHPSGESGERRIPTNWRDLYRNHFDARRPGHVLGDGSLTYTRPHILRFLCDTLPEARFVYIMRDPVERLKSARLQKMKTGAALLDVDAAIAAHHQNGPGAGTR